ncbi:fungal-specific transcription factor domain-containing protein [Stachybotrys elegans]|uniref:Fungal-specific transcription factor domain-containing protein n=1 Tax=Stachybotrys elegans TaxID=80388 RepID=A0A8K0SB36_9HYPO|nr:fungal-specific transcription factor domain-containing protein [Stachybotrys elegans]
MAPGSGIRAPVPRTRTGCLTCRKAKVKCGEERPTCKRCQRLQLGCDWSEAPARALISVVRRPRESSHRSATIPSSGPLQPPFVVEFPNADRASLPYINHFITFCSRFLAYANDGEANPFQQELVPLASSSPALLHSMIALAAGHMARGEPRHGIPAVRHYSAALRELNLVLSDPNQLASNSTLGACLMLCVYEISHSDKSLWLEHLQGARDLIMHRGGPRTSDFLSRFFSLLDISGSLSSGRAPLIAGNYWLEARNSTHNQLKWPYYDNGAIMVGAFHELMVSMSCLSSLSAESMTEFGKQNPHLIYDRAMAIRQQLDRWWDSQPPELRDQSNDWRTLPRKKPLEESELLEQESFSSLRSCKSACTIYLQHIINPTGIQPPGSEVAVAAESILAIARKTPEGYGLEMGLLWGIFMAGVVIFDDTEAETLIRRKLRSDASISIYHADRGLELLEILWERQHRLKVKLDWREIQNEMGIQVFILA